MIHKMVKNTAIQKNVNSQKIEIHVGLLLTNYLKKNKIRSTALARRMNLGISSFVQYKKNQSIQTNRLLEICLELNHNFFLDIAKMLPSESSSESNLLVEKDEQITQLRAEVNFLKNENDNLIKLLGL